MKVLFLLNQLSGGGSEKKSVRLVNDLLLRGLRIHLAYLEEPATFRPLVDSRIPIACLERKGKFSLKAFRNLRRILTEHGSEVILCMNLYPLLYAAIARLSLRKRPPKLVLAINTTDFGRRRDRWFMLLYAPLIRMTKVIVYGCEYQKELWERNYRLGGLPSLVIYNGIDTNHFDPEKARGDLRSELGIGDSFVVGCIGRLSPEKNQSALLNVAARLSRNGARVDVLLVGSGLERKRLERTAAELGIADRVHFLGQLDDVRVALSALDAFVLPSVAIETFSNAALEAMAMSVPVVLSDIAGASEMVTDGENGFLYQRDDSGKLEELLQRLRADPALRERLGRAARDTVLARFDVTRMVDSYERLLVGD